MEKKPLLSISIVNFNACQMLRDCLQSLRQNVGYDDLEVIVVDNDSHDGSVGMVRAEFPEVLLIANTENRGFNRANNQGLKRARGRYILSLNNDTIVPPGSLEKMVDFLETHPEYGAVGGRLMNPEGGFQWQCRRSFPTPLVALSYFLRLRTLFPNVDLFHRYTLTQHDPEESLDVDAISGACFMVRRDVLEQTGGMDDTFFMYGDDLDWSYRIHENGWKIRYLADAPITHYGGLGGAHHVSYRLIFHYYNAMWIFYRHHLQKHYSVVTTALVWLGIWTKAGLHSLQYALGLKKLVSRKK